MTCDWPISYASCSDCTPLTSSPASGNFEQMAIDFLRNWVGDSMGLCDVTIRPCRENCTEGESTFWGSGPFPRGGGSPWMPVIVNGSWINLSCGSCGDRCSCSFVEQIKLPGPVHSITSVQIDGNLLPSGAYRVDNRRLLVRTDGSPWPTCQDMGAPDGDPNTWSVTYKRGIDVPIGGQIAAGILACEFAKAVCGDGSCQLPKRVQSVSRQGVTIAAILDTFDDLQHGGTGIWLVDSWVASILKPRRTSSIHSVDVPRPRRQTWPF